MEKMEFCDSKGRPNRCLLLRVSSALRMCRVIQAHFPQVDEEVQLGVQSGNLVNKFPWNLLHCVRVVRTLVCQWSEHQVTYSSLLKYHWSWLHEKRSSQVLSVGRLLMHFIDVVCFNKNLLIRFSEGLRVPVFILIIGPSIRNLAMSILTVFCFCLVTYSVIF